MENDPTFKQQAIVPMEAQNPARRYIATAVPLSFGDRDVGAAARAEEGVDGDEGKLPPGLGLGAGAGIMGSRAEQFVDGISWDRDNIAVPLKSHVAPFAL